MGEPLLEVKDLKVSFQVNKNLLTAVDGVNFTLEEGRVLGIVGESGCGKASQQLLSCVWSHLR